MILVLVHMCPTYLVVLQWLRKKAEVLKLIQEAIQFHIEGLREDGLPVPPPSSSVEYVEVRAA